MIGLSRYFAPGDPGGVTPPAGPSTPPAPGTPPAGPATPPSAGPTPPATPPAGPGFFIKPDGTYVEKFYEHPSFPKEYADNMQLRTHTGIADTLKNFVTLEKIRGHHVVPIPAPNSDDAAWGTVADRLGRPAKPGDYKLPDPKAAGLDAKAVAPKEFIDGICQDLHESEITQRQAERLLTRWNKRIAAHAAATKLAAETARAEQLKPLREKMGAEFDANRTRVENFLRSRVPAERFEAVLALGVLDEPGLLEPLHQLAVQLGEQPPGLETPTPANVLAAAETEVAQLKASDAYLQEFHKDHVRTVSRVNELQQKLFAQRKTA